MPLRAASASIKAGPTVQRLIRAAGLDGYERLASSGPKGTVAPEDVAAAAAQKASDDAEASKPITIQLQPVRRLQCSLGICLNPAGCYRRGMRRGARHRLHLHARTRAAQLAH